MSMPQADTSLFGDLDAALRNGSPHERGDMLRRVTDLFLSDADRLNDKQVAVSDEVIEQRINGIEAKAPPEIGARPRHRR